MFRGCCQVRGCRVNRLCRVVDGMAQGWVGARGRQTAKGWRVKMLGCRTLLSRMARAREVTVRLGSDSFFWHFTVGGRRGRQGWCEGKQRLISAVHVTLGF